MPPPEKIIVFSDGGVIVKRKKKGWCKLSNYAAVEYRLSNQLDPTGGSNVTSIS